MGRRETERRIRELTRQIEEMGRVPVPGTGTRETRDHYARNRMGWGVPFWLAVLLAAMLVAWLAIIVGDWMG